MVWHRLISTVFVDAREPKDDAKKKGNEKKEECTNKTSRAK